MVSLIRLPAESAAVTRSATVPARLSLNTARNLPGPVPVTATGRQVFPPSCDTCTVAVLTAAAVASCRCAAEKSSTCRPGGADSFSLSPGTEYSSVIIGWTTQAWLAGQIHPAGSTAPACLAEGHVHTVRLDAASP